MILGRVPPLWRPPGDLGLARHLSRLRGRGRGGRGRGGCVYP
jgi:hypothetical protein